MRSRTLRSAAVIAAALGATALGITTAHATGDPPPGSSADPGGVRVTIHPNTGDPEGNSTPGGVRVTSEGYLQTESVPAGGDPEGYAAPSGVRATGVRPHSNDWVARPDGGDPPPGNIADPGGVRVTNHPDDGDPPPGN
ncbi:hypothetical protein ABT072_46755 [Streptomyces sp. NPDC002589]|uniref:hypothetical protein n=1 Tax=Streptomyces sp. NPDC002589 TaxID=3154420 RepID=UPI00332F26E8